MGKLYKLYTDGCYYPDYKIAGYGGYIEDQDGNVVVEFSEVIENPLFFTMHESLGMKRGLELCIEHNIKNINCYTDELGLSHLYRMNEEYLLPRYEKIPALRDIVLLKQQFENLNFHYIPREKNKKADMLSRKAALLHSNVINTIIKKREVVINDSNGNKQLDFVSNYKNKDHFIKRHKKIEDYIIINTSYGNEFLTTYYVKKDIINQTINVEVIDKVQTKENNLADILKKITEALQKKSNLDECIIFCNGGRSKDLEDIFHNKKSLTSPLIALYKDFQLELNKFKKITYHLDQEVMNYTIPPVKHVECEKLQETLFEAMKKLGQQDYVLGNNKAIENLILMKDSKKNDKYEIQKAYFGEFLKLHIKSISQSKISAVKKREFIELKIIEMREKLTNQGINFKMELKL